MFHSDQGRLAVHAIRKNPRSLLFVGAALLFAHILVSCATVDRVVRPDVTDLTRGGRAQPALADTRDSVLKVMTLNLAHGRRAGLHQIFQSKATAEANLNYVARVIWREQPDVIALQEADGPSFWSGSFNHVAYLAEKGGYSQYVRGEHVNGMSLTYGTALVSSMSLRQPVSVTFDPILSPPKGFLVSTIRWPDGSGFEVDVVSVHLDFLLASVREKQIEELIQMLTPRRRPLILMGDFNCEWDGTEATLRDLMDRLDLQTYRPEDLDLHTFPALRKRLDWILVSAEFDFVSHEVLPDVISDHRALVAEIRLREPWRDEARWATAPFAAEPLL